MSKVLKASAMAALFAAGLIAQSPAAIHDRAVAQQDRIADGVRSGEITPKEASKLEKKEAKLNHDMIKTSSREDRRKIVHKQHKLNRKITKAEKNDSYVK